MLRGTRNKKDLLKFLSKNYTVLASYPEFLYDTLQEHQRIRTNATVSKDSEIVKIRK